MAFRAIYSGLGYTDDPDVDDYYDRARGFPITYSPDNDPEVVEELKIAEAELKHGSDNGDEQSDGEGGSDSSSASLSSDEDDEDSENNWVDEEEEDLEGGKEKLKRKHKVLSCIEKVCDY